MTPKQKTSLGRKLSLVLRHKPEVIGLTLDENGWADVPELIRKMQGDGSKLTRAGLVEIVETNDKRRYSFSEDQSRIRANQGHSLENVDLQLQPQVPPAELFHGTATRFLDSILEGGINRGSRQHVHLSTNKDTAVQVGNRHGKVIILKIDAAAMVAGGYTFYLSANGVWLTDFVPVQYISR